ncbi:MAG: type II and III secretion system protein family protein [Acetobacteraceae bacterium]
MSRRRCLVRAATAGLLLLLQAVIAIAQPVEPARHSIRLESGSGRVITLGGPASNVFVADPKVAEVRPASPSSLFVFGVGPGRTTIAAMDSAGHAVAQYEVTVQPSAFGAGEAQAAIGRMMPGSRIRVQPQAKGLLLSGRVDTPAEAAQAAAIARGYIGENQAVDNQMSVQATTQVTLRVRIAEVSRQVVRNLGINWQSAGSIGSIGKLPALTFAANAGKTPGCIANVTSCLGANFNGLIDALAQDNLAHILAEPNLTVMSGQSASFLVGGEFPIPVAQQQGSISVEFKKFGVSLAFVPTVYSDGRINIHVSPEVSQISDQGAVQLTAGNSSIQIPAITVRRAETTIELGSGQSFAIAGLLQDTSRQTVSGLPFLMDIPVLGALFRSSSYQRNETELVILVTPIVVRPVDDEAALHLPTDGFNPASDLERIVESRQLARARRPMGGRLRIPGDAGFVVQ